jgi:hypothetical protein
VLPTRPLADQILSDDVVTALLVVALAARDRDLLDSVGMHDEHEPTGTDVCFEDVAVLTPKIAGEVEEPLLRTPRAKAIGPTAGACTIRPLPAMRVRVSEAVRPVRLPSWS